MNNIGSDWARTYTIAQLQEEARSEAVAAHYFWGTAGSIERVEAQAAANAEIERLGGVPETPNVADPAQLWATWEQQEREYAERGGWQPL